MVSKVIALALFVACSQAIRYDGHAATSSIVFNDNHNTIQHIPSAYAAPSHEYSAPISSYSNYATLAPVAQYATPAPVAHYAAPSTVAHYAAPATVAHYAAPVPVTHYAAPAVRVASPIVIKSATPSHSASSYSSLSFGDTQTHYAAPNNYAANAVAPVLVKAAPAKIAVAPVSYAHAAPAYNQGGNSGYQHEEEYAHPKYEFAYGVEDHHSGDIHSHKEVRDGDVTQGEYSLHEADGTIRTVKYTVDKHSGFNAIVERTGEPTKATAPAPYYQH